MLRLGLGDDLDVPALRGRQFERMRGPRTGKHKRPEPACDPNR